MFTRLPSFSYTDLISATQPPGTDSTIDTDLLLQMFLSELGSNRTSSSTHPVSPAFTLSISPPPMTSTVVTPSPLSSPVPSFSSNPVPAQSSSFPSPTIIPEATASDSAIIDDPFLASFADLDGLLKDSALFDNPTTTSDLDNMFTFPFQDPHVQDPILLDMSECLSLCSPSSSSITHSDISHTPCTEDVIFSPTTSSSLPSPIELSVIHDHTYTTRDDPSTDSSDQRKRKLSSVSTDTSLQSPTIEIDCNSPEPKRSKKYDNKYTVRRQKNNIASQVSRSKRRSKHRGMSSRVQELEETNKRLREQVKQMEAEAEELRKSLVQKLST